MHVVWRGLTFSNLHWSLESLVVHWSRRHPYRHCILYEINKKNIIKLKSAAFHLHTKRDRGREKHFFKVSRPLHTKPEKFFKRNFIPTVKPTVHINPSHKRSFFENALQTEKLKKKPGLSFSEDVKHLEMFSDLCVFKSLRRSLDEASEIHK